MTGMSGPGASGDETPRPFASGYPPNVSASGASPASGGAPYSGRPAAPPAARPSATARPARVVHARGARRSRRNADRDTTARFQGWVTAVGLALGLLLIAAGGLLNATSALPALDATPPAGQPTTLPTTLPTARVSPTVGAASPTATLMPTAVPATLSISPMATSDATCPGNNATLATMDLSNKGAVTLQWSATVTAPPGATVTLSTTTGQLNGGGQDSISVNNAGTNPISGATMQVTFTTMPAAAAPSSPVTITCA